MKLVTDPQELPHGDVALVPTMGALHQGHLSLVRIAKERADTVVVSVFVNPTQFGPHEDYDTYPRTLRADLELLESVGADVVFAPSVETMYPRTPMLSIDPGPIAQILDGAARPGHFAGVCLVVAKLFNLVRPRVAVFGQKDAQQLAVIRSMVADLSYPIEIVAAPIVREVDGLAMSSRNAYLTEKERASAPALYRALSLGSREDSPADQVAVTTRSLLDAGITPEYVEVVRLPEFSLVSDSLEQSLGDTCLLVAARLGSTRLIDNYVKEGK